MKEYMYLQTIDDLYNCTIAVMTDQGYIRKMYKHDDINSRLVYTCQCRNIAGKNAEKVKIVSGDMVRCIELVVEFKDIVKECTYKRFSIGNRLNENIYFIHDNQEERNSTFSNEKFIKDRVDELNQIWVDGGNVTPCNLECDKCKWFVEV